MPKNGKSNETGRLAIVLAALSVAGMLAASIFATTMIVSATTLQGAFAESYSSPPDQKMPGENSNSTKGNDSKSQSTNMGANASVAAGASYKQSYPKEKADDKRPFTVHAENHLYKPGDKVTLEGSILSSLGSQITGGITNVKLNVTDNKGNVTAQKDAAVDGSGDFMTTLDLPANAEQGAYTINAIIDVKADILGTLGASVKSKLDTSAKFEVISPNAFAVNAEGKSFKVDIASNSTVKNQEFNEQAKKISFHVEGQTGTRGVTQITIPKALLSGEITVSIDGKVIPPESSDVVVISDTNQTMTLEINYHHSEHTIEVSGTSVVPEFPMSVLVLAAAIGSIMAIVAITSRKSGINGSLTKLK